MKTKNTDLTAVPLSEYMDYFSAETRSFLTMFRIKSINDFISKLNKLKDEDSFYYMMWDFEYCGLLKEIPISILKLDKLCEKMFLNANINNLQDLKNINAFGEFWHLIPENQRVTIVERLQDISINFPSPEFTKLNKLNISNKALEYLNEKGIKYVHQLTYFSIPELKSIKCITKSDIEKIIKFFDENKMSFKDDVTQKPLDVDLYVDLEELGIPLVSRRILYYAGIQNLGQLISHTKFELANLLEDYYKEKNDALWYIESAICPILKKMGLKLKDDNSMYFDFATFKNNNENKNEKSINLSNIPREVLERRYVKGLGLEIKEEMDKVKFLDKVFNNASRNSMINKTYKDNGNQTDVRIDLK